MFLVANHPFFLVTQEEASHAHKQHLHQALQQGTRAWNRSKIMIVGDGRAGKTALANSIMDEEFAHTESTIGTVSLRCNKMYYCICGSTQSLLFLFGRH